ncbi:MAG: O-antigen ligase family protein [Selenomonadaceae bacterium]
MFREENSVLHADNSIVHIENFIFYSLCGYALFSSVSIAIGNVFLSLTILCIAVRLIKKHDDWRSLIHIDKYLVVPFAIYISVCLVTSLFSTDVVWSLRVISDYYLYRMTALFAVLAFVRDRQRLVKLFAIALGSFVLNDLVVIYQGLFEHNFRSPGFLGEMMTGGNLSMWVPVLVCLIAFYWKEKTNKYVLVLSTIIGCVALAFNGTRGAWIAVIIAVVFCLFLIIRSKIKAILAIFILMMVSAMLVFSVPQLEQRVDSITDLSNNSNHERILLWTSAVHMVKDYPLTGVGHGTFRENYLSTYILPEATNRNLGHAHSNFFHNLAEGGWPGAFAFCIWCMSFIVFCVRGWNRYRHPGYVCMLAIFLGLQGQGLTEYNMGDSVVMKLCWFGLALAFSWTDFYEYGEVEEKNNSLCQDS